MVLDLFCFVGLGEIYIFSLGLIDLLPVVLDLLLLALDLLLAVLDLPVVVLDLPHFVFLQFRRFLPIF